MTKHYRYDRQKAQAVLRSGKDIPPFAILLIGFAIGYLISRLRRALHRS